MFGRCLVVSAGVSLVNCSRTQVLCHCFHQKVTMCAQGGAVVHWCGYGTLWTSGMHQSFYKEALLLRRVSKWIKEIVKRSRCARKIVSMHMPQFGIFIRICVPDHVVCFRACNKVSLGHLLQMLGGGRMCPADLSPLVSAAIWSQAKFELMCREEPPQCG